MSLRACGHFGAFKWSQNFLFNRTTNWTENMPPARLCDASIVVSLNESQNFLHNRTPNHTLRNSSLISPQSDPINLFTQSFTDFSYFSFIIDSKVTCIRRSRFCIFGHCLGSAKNKFRLSEQSDKIRGIFPLLLQFTWDHSREDSL